jgi:hypothetical protein
MNEQEFFTPYVGCVPIRPVYYRGDWMALPLLNLYNQQIAPFFPEGVSRSPFKRSCRERNNLCTSLTVTLVPASLDGQELYELCKCHSIPIRWVLSVQPEELSKEDGESRRRRHINKRSKKPLNYEEYRKIYLKLREINFQSALICEILWCANRGTSVVAWNDYVDYITLEEVLQMQIEELPSTEAKDANYLTFTIYGAHDRTRSREIPRRLWKTLCKHVQGKCTFVFSNSLGGPVSPGQFNKHIQLAAKRAGVRSGNVSSLSFRSYLHSETQKINVIIQDVEQFLVSNDPFVSVEKNEWEHILRRFPELVSRRGRKSVHDPREMFNAILFIIRNQCSFEQLPANCFSREAVKSQYKRWKRKGLWDEICSFRLSSRSV